MKGSYGAALLLLAAACGDQKVTAVNVEDPGASPQSASTIWEGAPPDFKRPTPKSKRAPGGILSARIEGLPDLVAPCSDWTPIGVAFDGEYYYVAQGGNNPMCITRYTTAGVLVESKSFPVDFRGLHYVPTTGQFVAREFGGAGGQLWTIDYAAGTATPLTEYNARPCNPQSQPAADPDGSTYWVWDVECEGSSGHAQRRRISDNVQVASFPVSGTSGFSGGAIAVTATHVVVPNGESVNLYNKRSGELAKSEPMSSSVMNCFGYGLGASAAGTRVGYTITCTNNGHEVDAVRVESMAVEGESTERVEAGEAATVSVEEDGNGDGNASPVVGLDIPAGTFNEDVTVTVRLVEVTPDTPCHDFLIGQIGKCVEITAKNDAGANATLHEDLTVGVCLPEHLHLEMFKFETPQGRALPLQQVAADFLDCSDVEVASAAPRNWLEGLAMSVTKRVGKWITPKSAYAADRGFGGRIESEDGLSTFTWASPMQLSNAVLGVNSFNSGRDVYSVYGTLDLSAKTFDPCQGESGFNPASTATPPAGCEDPNKVIVAFGNHVQTINAGSFRKILGRWVYSAPFGTRTGILSLIINPTTGGFIFSGATPSEGVGVSPIATYRPFSVQIGHRTQGGGLECGVDSRYRCTLQH